jgi:hypothetical protein
MIMETLHWTISLGIWVGIATLVAAIVWTWWELKQSGGKK